MNDSSIIANKRSKIYHDPSCYFGQLVLLQNRAILDENFLENEIHKYRKCSKCDPIHPNQKTWDEIEDLNIVQEWAKEAQV